MKQIVRAVLFASAATAVLVAGLSSCSDDGSNGRAQEAPAEKTTVGGPGSEDGTSTDALSAVRIDETRLMIEMPADTPSYVLTAEVPAEWDVSAANGTELESESGSWDLVGPQGEGIAVTVYDTRNTAYADERAPDTEHDWSADDIAWNALGEFTGDRFGSETEFFIGNTEEVEVPEGFKGFDLLIVNDTPEGAQETSKFVVSLDGTFFVTFTTLSAIDAETARAVQSAYALILGTATAT